MTPDETRKMEERLSFKEFVIVVANIESDDYANLGNLPSKAREILLAEPPEIDPWDLLNQAQAEQQRLESLLTSRDAEIERLKAKLDSVWATQYQCPPCRNREHERHFIGEGKCACVPCFEKEYKVLDAEIERARELIRMAEKRRQCWDCDSKGGKHKIGCAVWKYLEAYVWEKPAQPKEEL